MKPLVNMMLFGTMILNPVVLVKTEPLFGRVTNVNMSANSPASKECSAQLVVSSSIAISICLA